MNHPAHEPRREAAKHSAPQARREAAVYSALRRHAAGRPSVIGPA